MIKTHLRYTSNLIVYCFRHVLELADALLARMRKGTVAAVGASKTGVVNHSHVDHFTGLGPNACPGRKSEGS
jgi:hypothetical protein